MKITINGKSISVEGKRTILEVARENGIKIPSLCDHGKLEHFAGCRMCIVDITGRKGYPPSCSTYVEDGMEVKTNTPELRRMRKQILELLLSEHPHSCLICEEKENCDEYKSTIRKVSEVTGCVLCPNNGRCELQKVVEDLKIDRVSFPSLYRGFDILKNDPFMDRNYNLCILCGRCVRMCHEIRGASVISFTYRGSKAVIGTSMDKTLLESGCQFCGACLDVCPTGALMERAAKYENEPENSERTVCSLCSMGCTLEVSLSEGRIYSTKPYEEGLVNRGQACVRGRFLVRDIVHAENRISKPMIRKNGTLEEVDWQEALDFVSGNLKKYKGDSCGLVVPSQASCEDHYLFSRFGQEALKTSNIGNPADLNLQACFEDYIREKNLKFDFNFNIKDISNADTIFILADDLAVTHPMVWLEVLAAHRKGARLVLIGSSPSAGERFAVLSLKPKAGTELPLLQGILDVVFEKFQKQETAEGAQKSMEGPGLDQCEKITTLKKEDCLKAAGFFNGKGRKIFLVDGSIPFLPSNREILSVLWNLSLLDGTQMIVLDGFTNSLGSLLIYRNSGTKIRGYAAVLEDALEGKLKALYLSGPFPLIPGEDLEFLVVQDCYHSAWLEKADAVLPAVTLFERKGVLVNTEGRAQKTNPSAAISGEGKPDWWIVSQIAGKMGAKGFEYKSPSPIMEELSRRRAVFKDLTYKNLAKKAAFFLKSKTGEQQRYDPSGMDFSTEEQDRDFPLRLVFQAVPDSCRGFPLDRISKSLSLIRDSRDIRLSKKDAGKLKLKDGEKVRVESPAGSFQGSLRISEKQPAGLVRAYLSLMEDFDSSLLKTFMTYSREKASLRTLPIRIKRGK
ncbi:MAG: molybdopterin-dependent oxidoreductase [Candidatus Aminicenantes bacterium]|nr:molybdopterin-dependent oxidoreductase [Candidatus Aminicenantes bacterium]